MSKPAFKRFENNKYKPWDVVSYGFKANMSDLNASLLVDQILNYEKLAKNCCRLATHVVSLQTTNFPLGMAYVSFPLHTNRY